MATKLFKNYQSQILVVYKKKKARNEISSRLALPRPADLKDECLAICEERFDKKDEMALRTFFGQNEGKEAYLKAIKKCNRDKFKPLMNFVKEDTAFPEPKNIELLAWLIDFKPRPYEKWKTHNLEAIETEVDRPDTSADEDGDKGKVLPGQSNQGNVEVVMGNVISKAVSPKPVTRSKAKNAIILTILLIAAGGFYWLWSSRQGKCMYWTGDHYQPVSCDQMVGGPISLVPFDAEKVYHFKRITNPNTITRKSIGRVWYAKLAKDSIEFYTSDGFHPIEVQLRLRPITEYIINKYIASK